MQTDSLRLRQQTRLRNHFIFPAQTSAVQKTVGFMWCESRVFTDLSFACAGTSTSPRVALTHPKYDQKQQFSLNYANADIGSSPLALNSAVDYYYQHIEVKQRYRYSGWKSRKPSPLHIRTNWTIHHSERREIWATSSRCSRLWFSWINLWF